MTLRTSTPEQEGIYQGSKYLKYPLLCDADELRNLFEQISPFYIYRLTGLSDGNPISQGQFIDEYGSWIAKLKAGSVPEDGELKRLLACAFVTDPEALWKQAVPQSRYIVKVSRPLVQVQAHFFTYSPLDGVFRSMTMGPNSIFWGLLFSFPQVYQDPKTQELMEVEESEEFTLFQKIKLWVRNETRATPFIADGKRTNVPIRLGKQCFSWIHHHPQLKMVSVYAG